MNRFNIDNSRLEIYSDASLKTFSNQRTFGCAGAIATVGGQIFGDPVLQVVPDSTNNESEALSVYLAVKAADAMINLYGNFQEIIIYSDSQITVFGLKNWMSGWINMMHDGVLYTSKGLEVRNQEIFKMIYDFLARRNIKIKLLHCKGHVNVLSQKSLQQAADTFYQSNGFYLDKSEIIKIANFNNTIDNITRNRLETADPGYRDKNPLPNQRFIIPINWKDYIR